MSARLANATLLRVDTPGVPSPSGRASTVTPGPALDVRVILSEPTQQVAWLISDLELSSTSVLYVEIADYPTAASDLVVKGRVSVQLDGEDAPKLLTIDHATKRVSPRLAHVQLLLKEI